ncbi:acetyltransferase [Coraliomargarita akajimensis]|uniref:Sugar O-acyltransferase, sialic acid O-acetyltransferase NeuD family n=1 Tax=Coraliomargarita akajimensis (strain DSM 45221 / IAM 15411 / JCM 23193 / KCTC 12865 / 04OKA010-24) TaxID=583355 RepID=D5EN01_CORAD|nr:acetyltransferase [Coraliomargarita akajimensis]ADE55391.1 sugar O-acyltransferase, sialic acid O- acetyltransferase NeuD family [Coraliomargarita akajimensis DSM 45221]
MKRLLIVGAGGFGRELAGWVRMHPGDGVEWSLAGFLDDDAHALDAFNSDLGVIASIADYQPQENEYLLCGIGSPQVKRSLCTQLMERGARFMSYLHPTVIVGERVRIGEGVICCPRVTLTCDITLGDFAAINCHSSVGHDVQIGAWSTLSGHCDVTGGVCLEEEAFLGSGARILPGKRIAAASKVGAGAVVVRSTKAGETVFGNPACRIG